MPNFVPVVFVCISNNYYGLGGLFLGGLTSYERRTVRGKTPRKMGTVGEGEGECEKVAETVIA